MEALAQLADWAAASFGDVEGVMWGMTNVLLGVDPNSTDVWKLGVAGRYNINPSSNPYWIGEDWLRYLHDPSLGARHSEQGDWKSDYWDGTPNQAFHFWYFVSVQYYDNALYANAANIVHDPYWLEGICGDDLQRLNRIPIIGPRITPLFGETSQEDFALGLKGMQLGNGLWWSFDVIPSVCVAGHCTSPVKVPGGISDPGSWIRANLQRTLPSTTTPSNPNGPAPQ